MNNLQFVVLALIVAGLVAVAAYQVGYHYGTWNGRQALLDEQFHDEVAALSDADDEGGSNVPIDPVPLVL